MRLESLWVRWVHDVYTKGGNWFVFNPPITPSWSFKKICRAKDRLGNWILQEKYIMKDVFHDNSKDLPKVHWSRFTWNTASNPKGKFILWLIVLHKLKTKSKLPYLMLVNDDQFPMCLSAVENTNHFVLLMPL